MWHQPLCTTCICPDCCSAQWIRFAEVVYLRPDTSSSSCSSSQQQQHGGVEERVVLFVVGDAVAAGRTNPAAVEAIAKAQVGAPRGSCEVACGRVGSHGVRGGGVRLLRCNVGLMQQRTSGTRDPP